MNSQWQRVLAGAIVGDATGTSAVLLYTNGLFVADLTREFGLTRSAFALGVQAAPADAREWLRSRTFWTLACAFAAMSLSFGGLLPHFVPMLLDFGLQPLPAARISGEIGLAVIASRLVVGFLLDRVFVPRVAIVLSLIGVCGGVALLLGGAPYAPVTAVALGLTLGARSSI